MPSSSARVLISRNGYRVCIGQNVASKSIRSTTQDDFPRSNTRPKSLPSWLRTLYTKLIYIFGRSEFQAPKDSLHPALQTVCPAKQESTEWNKVWACVWLDSAARFVVCSIALFWCLFQSHELHLFFMLPSVSLFLVHLLLFLRQPLISYSQCLVSNTESCAISFWLQAEHCPPIYRSYEMGIFGVICNRSQKHPSFWAFQWP